MKIVIATRESRLALWQAEHVKARLQVLGHTVDLLPMTTQGDQILDRSLSKVGGKGLFVKELETALADGRADLAVHSLKDVPMELPAGFELACVMEREDPHDALVLPQQAQQAQQAQQIGAATPPSSQPPSQTQPQSLQDLPHGAVVGTSSLRRVALLKALRPDLKIAPLRGNLDTRLRKLDEGQYAAIVLAAAGLKRLGLGHRIAHTFDSADMLPAAGQGALGIEICKGRSDLVQALAPLAHLPTWLAVAAEREVSRSMGGSCSMPLAAFAHWQGDQLQLRAAYGELSELDELGGDPQAASPATSVTALVLARAHGAASVHGLPDAQALGARVAAALKLQVQALAKA